MNEIVGRGSLRNDPRSPDRPVWSSCQHGRTLIVGPIERVQLRQVPGDWVLRSTVVGRDVAESVEEFGRAAERRGDAVEPGDAVEDRNERITGALRS